MDQKTLEYMGARVDKAREIQKRIAELEYFINYSNGKSRLHIHDEHGNGPRIKANEFPRLFGAVESAVWGAIQEEIKLLQQELDEL